MLKEERQYFDRHLKLLDFGEAAQEKLLEAKVLVVGVGGLGCPLLQYLVTAGVKQLGIVDGDTISASNLHRQILYNRDDVGFSKTEIASKKIKYLQPQAQIKEYNLYLNDKNILEIFNQYDVVVDGTDNFTTRYLINDACVMAGKPLVSGAVSNYTGQLSVFNYQGGPTYRCLFPEEPADEECSSCFVDGILNILPGLIALYMANEVIKVITGYGDTLSGKLLLLNIKNNHHQIIRIDPIFENQTGLNSPLINSTNVSKNNLEDTLPIKENNGKGLFLNVEAVHNYLDEHPETQLIDVREQWEFDEYNIGGTNIPLFDLSMRKKEIDLANPVIFICQTGKRSLYAAHILKMDIKVPLIAQITNS